MQSPRHRPAIRAVPLVRPARNVVAHRLGAVADRTRIALRGWLVDSWPFVTYDGIFSSCPGWILSGLSSLSRLPSKIFMYSLALPYISLAILDKVSPALTV